MREMKPRYALVHVVPYTSLIKVIVGSSTSNFFECSEPLSEVVANWSNLNDKAILSYVKGARFLLSDLPGIKLGMELTNSKVAAHNASFEGEKSSILTTDDIYVLEFEGTERKFKQHYLLSEFC